MLIISIILLLLAKAVTLRREKSIFFNRVAILILLYSGILAYDSLAIGSLATGIGVFSGLFHSTSITHSFDVFIYTISALILRLTSFYATRRLIISKLRWFHYVRLISWDLTSESFDQINKEQLHVPAEYSHKFGASPAPPHPAPLRRRGEGEGGGWGGYVIRGVILFIVIGATFLMSSSAWVSMLIAIELQSVPRIYA